MDPELPRLRTRRLTLSLPGPDQAEPVAAYFQRNQEHLGPWDPPRPEDDLTQDYWRATLAANQGEFRDGLSLRFFLSLHEGPVVGTAHFTGISRGPLQACSLGYGLDHAHTGQGLMTEALERAIRYVFEDLALHRIEASYMRENHRSAGVLRRLGFQVEGFSPDYLFIDGAWRDHLRTALRSPDNGPPRVLLAGLLPNGSAIPRLRRSPGSGPDE